MKLTYAELWRAKHAECQMKITYDELIAFCNMESLYTPEARHYVGSFKEIDNFTTKSRDGAVITGYAALFPDISVKDDVIVVDVHTVVFSYKSVFLSYAESSCERIQDWQNAEREMANLDIVYRSVKRDIPLTRWMANTLQSWNGSGYVKPDGTAIQRAADSISQHMKFEGYAFNYDWLTGQALVDRYRSFQSTSPSCMTGSRCEQVRLWSTNGKQCRLLVIKDGEHEIARTLCFRPGPSVDKLDDDILFGPGWFYGRIYNVSSESKIPIGVRVTQATAWMRQNGLVEASIRNCPGAVPLIVTEYAPYIDRGYVFAKSKDEGETCYWSCESEPEWLPSSRWEAIESNQHGDGFGRSAEEDDASCSCCDCRCSSEDITYVQDYGDVCSDCLDGGGFTYCMNDEWYPSDDTVPVYFDNMSDPIGYIASNRDTVSVWYNGRRHTFHRAIDSEECTVYAPAALTHTVLGHDDLYAGCTDDLVTVKHELSMNEDGTLTLSDLAEESLCFDRDSVLYRHNDETIPVYASWLNKYSVTSVSQSKAVYYPNGSCMLDERLLNPVKYLSSILYVGDDNIIAIKLSSRTFFSDKVPSTGTQWNGKIPVVRFSSRQLYIGNGLHAQFVDCNYTMSYEYPSYDPDSFKYGCFRSGWNDLYSPFGTVIQKPGIIHSSLGLIPCINNNISCQTIIQSYGFPHMAFIGETDDAVTRVVLAHRCSRDRFFVKDPIVIQINNRLYLDNHNYTATTNKINAAFAAIKNLHATNAIQFDQMTDEAVNLIRETLYNALTQ